MTWIKQGVHCSSSVQTSRYRQDIQLCDTRHRCICSHRSSSRDPWVILFIFEVGFRRCIGQHVSLRQLHPLAI